MSNQIIPDDLNLMNLALLNWVLSRIKIEILTGRPSGQVIDQALDEIMGLASCDQCQHATV